jgi:hypothetical protein
MKVVHSRVQWQVLILGVAEPSNSLSRVLDSICLY